MGVTLLPGEFDALGVHSEVPTARQKLAQQIVNVLDLDYNVNYNADSLNVPTQAECDKAKRDLFLSASLYHVVNTVIGHAGSTNLAVAMGQLNVNVEVPPKFVAFAAMMVNLFSPASIPYSYAFLFLAGI